MSLTKAFSAKYGNTVLASTIQTGSKMKVTSSYGIIAKLFVHRKSTVRGLIVMVDLLKAVMSSPKYKSQPRILKKI